MALPENFPKEPHAVLDPDIRWFPAPEALREKDYQKLLPPLVDKLRRAVKEWRDKNYDGATETSKALLKWWFLTEHPVEKPDGTTFDFQYYFGQRESVETIIYLHDVANIKDKYDLLRYDSSNAITAGMFEETWRRYVIKMATGSGKTKVLSLILAWSFFCKTYEENSDLARNFLVITPNIIVLDRIRTDFDGLKIFFEDPILPDNGFKGRDWRDDFQLTLHIQDELNVVNDTGNIFLTNIHRVYESNDKTATYNDEDLTNYFLGKRPVGATNESKVNLDEIVRDVNELMILNDEAHHVHDPRMAWFKSIEDINNKLKMKGSELSMQLDVTATPKHDNGSIFVQTVSDYPLVEAIYQGIVKKPVLPDMASRAKLVEKKSSKFTEKYEDYIHLGYLEWKKVYNELSVVGKKPILFIMTDDTKNCDEVARYLERYPEFKDAVLVIHTKDNGEISETISGKSKEELEALRKAANAVDGVDSPYKVIVSVLMLKEGWDVKNVTTIVGLRAYSAKSNILPEQTLGRGLRPMFRGEDVEEYVSVVGTDAFIEFVESIKTEGVEFERTSMGAGTKPKSPVVIEVDNDNVHKDIEKLDIKIPVLTPRVVREYKKISDLDVKKISDFKPRIRNFTLEEQREIAFKHIVKTEGDGEEIHHRTILDSDVTPDYHSVVGYFTQVIMKELRLFSGYEVLYEKVKSFIQYELFGKEIDLEDGNILRNLSEIEATNTIINGFKRAINELTIEDKGEAEIRDYIKVSNCRPFVAKEQAYLVPKKSPLNKIIGDSHLELEFAGFLEECEDVTSYIKNYFSVHFKIDYQNADGDITDYYPDFVVRMGDNKTLYVVETKGLEDLDAPLKYKRLKEWCNDVNKLQKEVIAKPLYVKQKIWDKQKLHSFGELVRLIESSNDSEPAEQQKLVR